MRIHGNSALSGPVMSYLLRILLLCLYASCASAHNTWLIPEPPTESRNYWTLGLTTGDTFPAPDQSTRPGRVARAELITGTGTVPLVAMTPNARTLPFRVVADDEPLKVAVVALWPLDIELQSDAVERYVRDELGGEASFTERFRSQGRWRERYTKNAKTLIRTGGGRADSIATQPHGLNYELVPSIDPTLTQAGTAFEVCAFADNRRVTAKQARVHIGLSEANGRNTLQPADRRG
jgi:hypothetical protein